MEQIDEVTRQTWKNQALLERVRDITTQYEDQLANARVNVTFLTQQVERLEQENAELQARIPTDVEVKENPEDDSE